MTSKNDNSPDANVATADSESAFRRWSRRKHEARIVAREGNSPPHPMPAPVTEPTAATPERVLTDADMPPIETLDEQSDFSPFMSPGVSDALRQAALRRLFRSAPMNVLCELEGEFYDTHGLTPLGNIVTYDMRAALKRELEEAKSKAKERVQDELTDAEVPDVASETSEIKAAPDRAETDGPRTAEGHADENPQNDKGVT